MRSPPPDDDEREYKPVLYVAPAWVPDCGVDELLRECGLDPTARSSHQAMPDSITPAEVPSGPRVLKVPNGRN